MTYKSWVWTISIAVSMTASVWAGTFGKVIPLGGLASDLALDEQRGLLYVANFTANRVEVISLGDNTVQRSMNVASQPSSLSISPDGKYLVIAHYGQSAAPAPPSNALTVVNLETNERQTFALGAAPLGVQFGADGKALIATTTEFLRFDPETGSRELIDTVQGVAAAILPQPANSIPASITAASMGASRDGSRIYGQTDALNFGYDVASGHIQASKYQASPSMSPRVVSVNQDGSLYAAGWGVWDGNVTIQGKFGLTTQFADPTGDPFGTHVIDTSRNLLYSQVVTRVDQGRPILRVADVESLAIREMLQLPENFAGKSVITNDNNTVYGISESGVMVLPVGSLDQVSRVAATEEDVVFRGNFCRSQISTQEITIVDSSGGATDFAISLGDRPPAGITVFPMSGTTPARVRVTIDPARFTDKGTSSITLNLSSSAAANIPKPIRVLINNKEPDQRGSFVNIPGKLVDVMADPIRNRYYVLRQDTNEVLVFDGETNSQIASLKTGNTPSQLAITFDKKNLLIGSNDSQLISVYELDTLEATTPVRMPGGHYPRSIASTGNTVLAASRFGSGAVIDRVDMASRTATQLPSLGIFENTLTLNTVLIGSPNGSSIMVAQPTGNVLLYSASADTFTISRKLPGGALSGAYAASSYDQFVVGNLLLNASLVPTAQLGSGAISTGFAFVDQTAYRASAPTASSAGVLQRFDPKNISTGTSARMVEAPILADLDNPFTRTLAPLANRSGIVALTTSGLTIFPWNYDAAVLTPKVDRVVNGADFSSQVAPNGLITIQGSNLNAVNQSFAGSTGSLPDSCIQVNGITVPVLYASPTQINAQLPAVDSGTLRLATPGGVIENVPLDIAPTGPAVFRVNVAGVNEPVPAVVRSSNGRVVTPSNPVHHGDVLVIYATGLGHTTPDITPGTAAPSSPLAGVTVTPFVTIAGVEVQTLFAGLSPGQIGVYQINVKVYGNVPKGFAQPLVIRQGNRSTSVTVRVID